MKSLFSRSLCVLALAGALQAGPAVPASPSIMKSFGVAAIPLNGTTSVTFNISNPNAATSLTGIFFTDTLPAGLIVATPNGLTGSCGGGMIIATVGSGSILLAGATLAGGAACTFSVNVTGTTSGMKNNSVTVGSTNGGTGNTSMAPLTVAAPPPLTKVFGAASINVGETTSLSFTLSNTDTAVTLTGLAFSDTLPVGLAIAAPNGLTGNCGGGTITAVAGTNTIALSGATLAAGASCTFSLSVIGIGAGAQTNTTSTVASTNGPAGAPASATISIVDAFLIRYSSNLNAGDSVINITNSGANGASLNGPGIGGGAGNLCVNVYAFSPDEQLISCCSCLVTPNGLVSLSTNADLVSNTLTGVKPNSVVVKLLSTSAGANFTGTSCVNSAALAGTGGFQLASGSLAWGTTLHAIVTPPAGAFSVTETKFSQASLGAGELASITNRCTFIIGNGSAFGICRSCRGGGLGGAKE